MKVLSTGTGTRVAAVDERSPPMRVIANGWNIREPTHARGALRSRSCLPMRVAVSVTLWTPDMAFMARRNPKRPPQSSMTIRATQKVSRYLSKMVSSRWSELPISIKLPSLVGMETNMNSCRCPGRRSVSLTLPQLNEVNGIFIF